MSSVKLRLTEIKRKVNLETEFWIRSNIVKEGEEASAPAALLLWTLLPE